MSTGMFTDFSTFTFPRMPNLVYLALYHIEASTLSTNLIHNLPSLSMFELLYTNVSKIPDNFFTTMTSGFAVKLNDNKLKEVDLHGLSPDTTVDLRNNLITKLPEKNFRNYVESVLYTPNAWGNINMDGKYAHFYADKILCDYSPIKSN